ncbi:CAP domain-containing protein [Pseudonocardia sp. WMMC193]|uniref:CAP domain-containing protein n=1 Tax=Pseudonocardia sp. WMMC193 TaxID=2911965 RepID=UPI001F3DAD18|nr:CAP domain-containing protein [Pseudonocardia sp. WMMC193]MCF7553820.1 CAP domain-containing protein [Pseudonocardia sp. WMMC193]
MSPLRRLRRVAVAGAAAVMMSSVGLAVAAPAASAAPTPIDYRAVEQQIAEAINEARLRPGEMAATLSSLTMVDANHAKLPSGAQFQVTKAYLDQSAKEAATQPPLPALAWSETLAKYARDYVYAQNRGGVWSLGHNSSYRGFPSRPELKVFSIEAIGNGDPSDARSTVYRWWTSMNEWSTSTRWDSANSFQNAGPGRGHRGIVNDARMNAIGVGCGSPIAYSGTTYVACIAIDGKDLPDASPAVTPAAGAPSLSTLPPAFTGSVGSKPADGQSTLTVDTTAPTTPQASPTTAANATVETAGGAQGPADATAAPAADGRQPGDLTLGDTWDVKGDGSFLITVRPQDTWVPSDRATITDEAGIKSTTFRGYEVTYQNNTDTPVPLPDVVAQWACTSGNDLMPFVIDPPGQGLPAPGMLGRGKAVFAFGCGVGADGFDTVGARLGNGLGSDRVDSGIFWVPR